MTCGGPAASEATVGTGTAAPGVEAFCTAEVAAEAAAGDDDEAALRDAFETLAAEADEPLGDAYTKLIEFMRANCGFNKLALTAAETSFTGVPSDVPAGAAILTVRTRVTSIRRS